MGLPLGAFATERSAQKAVEGDALYVLARRGKIAALQHPDDSRTVGNLGRNSSSSANS